MTTALAQDQLDRIAGALADRTRRGLLRLVRDGESSAGELASAGAFSSRAERLPFGMLGARESRPLTQGANNKFKGLRR